MFTAVSIVFFSVSTVNGIMLFVRTAGGINETLYKGEKGYIYILHMHTASDGLGYTVYFHIAGGGKGYSPHVVVEREMETLRTVAAETPE